MLHFPIYLDNCATTACDENVVAEMLPYFSKYYGNASSKGHPFGWEASAAVEKAIDQITSFIHAEPTELVFTSGATEACNLAIRGVVEMYASKGNHIITTKVEHKAVLDTCQFLEEKRGFHVTYLDVDEDGLVAIDALQNAITPQTILIAIMYANNETGVIMPIAAIGELAREKNIIFFTDATQAIGKLPINVKRDCISLMAFNAHKLYGPKGIGALYTSRKNPRVKLTPQITGGGQQNGIRSGTMNVPAIAGFGKAIAICAAAMHDENKRLLQWRNMLEQSLLQLPHVFLNGNKNARLPHVSNISFEYLNSNEILAAVNKEFAVSSGSACTSGSLDPSYVLKAMHKKDEIARASIRFSLGRFTTIEEVKYTIQFFTEKISSLRKSSAAWQLRD